MKIDEAFIAKLKAFQKYHRFWCVFLACLLWMTISNGQATNDPKEDFLYGEYYLEQYKYNEALSFYLSSLKHQPENSNLNYRVGQCYLKIVGEQHQALPYLKKAIHEINENYVAGKYKNSGAPIEAWLFLGDAYHRENKLLDASYAYHKYKELIGDTDKEKTKLIHDRIIALGISNEYQRTEDTVRIINLGQTINSRFSDYNPVLSGDQMVLVYTQYWESYDRIMISRRSPDGWTEPIEINGQIESSGNCYTSAISYYGTELYLIKNVENNYDIYVSEMKDRKWEPMKPLLNKINTRYHESSVCISSDGYYLYFASNRPGGEGGFDIYRANKEEGEWSNVVNLGPIINTGQNEEAPYITMDGSILYFSSNGHETIGNMDIIYSEISETGGWKDPYNIGAPINTTEDDLFYIYFNNTSTGYLSRDMAEGYGKNDLYRVQTGEDPVFAFNELDFLETKYVDKGEIETDNIASSITYTSNEGLAAETADYIFEPDSIPTYTIQVMALKKPIDMEKLDLSHLIVSSGNDGLNRYTYGQYIGWSKALLSLYDIRESGFPDAFIRNIDTIENYAGEISR